MKQKKTIGRTDRIDLPEFNISELPAKIDTGAYTSSIHCDEVYVEQVNGQAVLHFQVRNPKDKMGKNHWQQTTNFRKKSVTSSSGHTEKRFLIKTVMLLFGKKYITEFSLTDRQQMKYPVLLGRKLLNGRFVVDVSQYDLSHHAKG